MSTKTIVLFGESGAGKSSVVNLMAGQDMAKPSPGTEGCTLHWKEHSITSNGCRYNVFDTVGLCEPQLGMKEYLGVILNAHDLITRLQEEGDIDLLLFCVRAGRFSSIQNNYRLFYEWLCEKKAPVVLILTGLETEQNMEDWWTKYKHTFNRYGIAVDGHACITAASGMDGRHQLLYEESRRLVWNLVRRHTHDQQGIAWERDVGWNGGEGWFPRFIRKLRGLLPDKYGKNDIVTVLTKRCGMPREAAVQLANQTRDRTLSRASKF